MCSERLPLGCVNLEGAARAKTEVLLLWVVYLSHMAAQQHFTSPVLLHHIPWVAKYMPLHSLECVVIGRAGSCILRSNGLRCASRFNEFIWLTYVIQY